MFWNNIILVFNQKFLNKLPRKLYTYNSINVVKNNTKKQQHLLQKFLQLFILFGLPLSTLCWKFGALIILLQNLYQTLRKCDKTLLIITQIKKYYIKSQILEDKFNS